MRFGCPEVLLMGVCRHASAFFGTELVSKLVFLGVDTVVITGVSTSGCVRATALDALSYNFRPLVCPRARLQIVHFTE